MSPPDPWRHLAALIRSEDPHALPEHLEQLAGSLGLAPGDLSQLLALDGAELASRLRVLIREHQAEGRARRARLLKTRAESAARRLADSAEPVDRRVQLTVSLLLGELLHHPTAKFIGFELPGVEPIYIAKSKLREVARTFRRVEVTAYLDASGLHFRWRGGRGGLDLCSRIVSASDRPHVLRVTWRSAVAPLPPRTREVAQPRRGAWLGEVLAELGFPV